jgi:hypothetical protein
MPSLLENIGPPEFFIDRLIIYSKRSNKEVVSWLPLNSLQLQSINTHLKLAREHKGGYKSVLDAIFLLEKWIGILCHANKKIGKKNLGDYAISYLELSYEWHLESHKEAIYVAKHIAERIRKLNSKNVSPLKTKLGQQDDHIYYFAACEPMDSNNGLVIYSRNSKLDGKPIVKVEWRLRTSRVIARHSGIETLEDIPNFNSQIFFKENFMLEDINYDEFADWLNPSNMINYNKNKRPFRGIHAGRLFCRINYINSSHALRAFLKRAIRNANDKKEKLTSLDKKVLLLSPYRVNKFFIRLVGD